MTTRCTFVVSRGDNAGAQCEEKCDAEFCREHRKTILARKRKQKERASSDGTIKRQKTSIEVKIELGVLKTELGIIKTELGVLKTELGVLKTELGVLKTEIGVLKTELAWDLCSP
jgi:chromosome segregation ATPase